MTKIIEGGRDGDLAESLLDYHRVAAKVPWGGVAGLDFSTEINVRRDGQSDCGRHVIEEFSPNS